MRWFKKKSKAEKRDDFSKMEVAFTDSNGVKYYKYLKDLDIPIIRFSHLQVYIQEMAAGFNRNEIELFLTALETALAGTEKTEGKPDIGMMGWLLKEMRMRKDVLAHEEVLFWMVAALYIREDQNPAVWDEEIEEQKIKQFKLDSQGGLYGFFYGAGLSKYMPYFEKLKGDLTAYLRRGENKVKAMKMILEDYGLDSGSLPSLKEEKVS